MLTTHHYHLYRYVNGVKERLSVKVTRKQERTAREWIWKHYPYHWEELQATTNHVRR